MRRIVFLLAIGSPTLAVAAPVRDTTYSFGFSVPDGFGDFPEGRRRGAIHAYVRGEPDHPHYEEIIMQALGGTIGRGSLNRAHFEAIALKIAHAPPHVEYRKVVWRGFELELIVAHFDPGPAQTVMLSTVVPLQKHAVQIARISFAADEARLSADFQNLLTSVDGVSSWRSNGEPSEGLISVLGLIVGLAVGLTLSLWWKRRRDALS